MNLKRIGIAALVVGTGGAITMWQLSTPSQPQTLPTRTWEWEFNNPVGSGVTEWWSSTNLVDWVHYNDIPGTSATLRATIPTTNAYMFFKIRNRDTNGETSDWCRLTN